MSKHVHLREIEIKSVEERSKRKLIAAKQDAKECIDYFKNLAISKTAKPDDGYCNQGEIVDESGGIYSPPPIQRHRPHSFERQFHHGGPLPMSLAPVLKTCTPQRRQHSQQFSFRSNNAMT